jgi:hypothetical protein
VCFSSLKRKSVSLSHIEPEEAVKYFMMRVPELTTFKNNKQENPLEFAWKYIGSIVDVKAAMKLVREYPCSILDFPDEKKITPLQYCKYT